MGALKVIRNVIGTAGIVFAGYIFLGACKDIGRYIRIIRM